MAQREESTSVFDEIERLRAEYLRELTGLSKIFIAISTAMLGLLLSPFGINLSAKVVSRIL